MTAADDGGPVLLASARDIQAHLAVLAARIDADHPGGVTLVGVLKGGAVFLADLARLVTVPVRIELLAVAPYDGATERTRVVKDIQISIRDQAVVLVTGIVDTGLTADFLLRHLAVSRPSTLQVCALADKQARRLLPIRVDYVGLEAPDAFLIGYGLDYAGRYRNLPDLWQTDGQLLADDPDRYVAELYGRQGR